MKRFYTLLALAALVMSASVFPVYAESKVGKKAVVEAGRIVFQYRCRVCHTNDTNRPSYGPTLKNIFGRKAGSVVGFQYSDALKNSGLIWDEKNLLSWIQFNQGVMPGTRMRHVGVTDKAEQEFLIAYLKSLSE